MKINARNAGALAAAIAIVATMSTGRAAAGPAEVRLLGRAYNAAGQQLFRQLAASPGNLTFSPYSIATAMSVAISGARGDTASEMRQAMSMRMAADAIDMASAGMRAILNGYDRSAARTVCPGNSTFNGRDCEMPAVGPQKNLCPHNFRLVGDRCVGPPLTLPSARLLAANALMLHAETIEAWNNLNPDL